MKILLFLIHSSFWAFIGFLLAKYKIVRIIFITSIINMIVILAMINNSCLNDFWKTFDYPWYYAAILGVTSGILVVTGQRKFPKNFS
jgi:hypothetical protein|tara:strand:+ start:449 stop:709 length:261 start_codon:yes stop_codon:yes gene_type:complete